MANRFRIPYSPRELDLPRCVNSGQVFRWSAVADNDWLGVDGENWYRVLILEGLLEVESNADESAFRNLFRLDWDSQAIEAEVTTQDPRLSDYFAATPGLRVMRPSSSVETFFCFLCTPNNNVKRITGMINRLATYGEPMSQDLLRFPTIEKVASIPEEELRRHGFGYRARTIPEAARHLLDRGGEVWLESLKRVPYQEAHAALLEIPGIGPKLADCIALFGLDQTEAVPVDTHIWQAATRLYFPQWQGSALTATKYQAVGDEFRQRFGKRAGWVQQYLFYDNMLNWRARKSTG